MKFQLVAAFACLAASTAQAETCKYVDADGRVTYSNVDIRGAKKVMCFEQMAPSAPPPPVVPKPLARPQASPSTEPLPSVARETQKKRDEQRRRILEDELAQEEKLLAAAKVALAEGEQVRLGSERNYQKYLDRIQSLRDNVQQHERNVAALRQEIAGIK